MKPGSITGEEMRKKSKKDLVLIHLQMHGSITSWEAIEKFRATRLSDIVFKLKQDGHNISSKPEQNKETGTNMLDTLYIKRMALQGNLHYCEKTMP